MRKAVISVILAIIVILGCISCGRASPTPTPELLMNSVPKLAREFGVTEDKVRSVAQAMGVSPEETGSFGPGFFPENYIDRQFERIREEKGHVTRDDVDEIMRGYELKCDTSIVYYMYYNTNVTVMGTIFGKIYLTGTLLVLRLWLGRREHTASHHHPTWEVS